MRDNQRAVENLGRVDREQLGRVDRAQLGRVVQVIEDQQGKIVQAFEDQLDKADRALEKRLGKKVAEPVIDVFRPLGESSQRARG